MNVPSLNSLDLELSANWLSVWFNDPQQRNPLTRERVDDLLELCEFLHDKRDIRGVTFRGRGEIFCAGGDLKAFQVINDGGDVRDHIVDLSKQAAILFDSIDKLRQFTIMVVEGAAMAGGFGLACCGDFIIAQSDAKFALSEPRMGLVAAQIAPFVQRRLGLSVARRLLLTAAPVSGHLSQDLGIVDAPFRDQEELNSVLADLKSSVLKTAPDALARTKALIRDLPGLSREDQIERAANDFADCLMSEESKEGIASFLERRKPKWMDQSDV